MRLQFGYLTALLWVLLSADDCVYKECDCSSGQIECGNKNFTQMPQAFNLSVVYGTLVLNFNKITEIPANSLPFNLSEIDLINNPTTTIADTAFDGSVYTLETLIITLALFTRIPNAFGHLRALKSLTIEDVNVQDWNDEAMEIGGQTLTSLYFDNVSLSSWPNWLRNFSQLTDLTIIQCSIPSIPDGALDKLSTNLTGLNLGNNNLTSIPKALSQLTALTSLNLEQNNIVDITWIPQSSHLNSIYLNNNRIANSLLLTEGLRQMGRSLQNIKIKFNQLTSIPDFTSMANIFDLDFSHNKLSDPYSGSIRPIIYTLDLSFNFMPSIPSFVSTLYQATVLTFSSNVITSFVGADITPSAAILDLGYNLITEINDNSFPNNSHLTTLYLNNNPIVTFSILAFTKIPSLTELNLRNTELTRLPLALSSLSVLSILDLTDNVGLVCTCMEKSLESWVRKLPSYVVSGNCGVISIYNFFTKLSPDCPTQ